MTPEDVLELCPELTYKICDGYGFFHLKESPSKMVTEIVAYSLADTRQKLAQRDEQIAALRAILQPMFQEFVYWSKEDPDSHKSHLINLCEQALQGTQAAAEAHNAKQQAIGRKAILQEILKLWDKGFIAEASNENEFPCHFPITREDIETLLSQEPG